MNIDHRREITEINKQLDMIVNKKKDVDFASIEYRNLTQQEIEYQKQLLELCEIVYTEERNALQEVITITTVYLRNGRKLEVSNPYSLVAKFIQDNTGQAIQLIDIQNDNNQYLVRKDAIDYIETTIN